MLRRILTHTCSSFFFTTNILSRSVSCASISCGFWLDRILISEALRALFLFPIKHFMQELIHSMFEQVLSKGLFMSLQQEIIALLLSNFTIHHCHMQAEKQPVHVYRHPLASVYRLAKILLLNVPTEIQLNSVRPSLL